MSDAVPRTRNRICSHHCWIAVEDYPAHYEGPYSSSLAAHLLRRSQSDGHQRGLPAANDAQKLPVDSSRPVIDDALSCFADWCRLVTGIPDSPTDSIAMEVAGSDSRRIGYYLFGSFRWMLVGSSLRSGRRPLVFLSWLWMFGQRRHRFSHFSHPEARTDGAK